MSFELLFDIWNQYDVAPVTRVQVRFNVVSVLVPRVSDGLGKGAGVGVVVGVGLTTGIDAPPDGSAPL